MNDVRLRGDGLAVAACAELFGRAGWSVAREGPVRPKLPVVLLNGATQHLLVDLFRRPEMMKGLYRVDKRIVRWGAETVALPHVALAVGEAELLALIKDVSGGTGGTYVIHGAKPLPEGVGETSFGERAAEAVAVRLQPGAVRHACWVEAVEAGWLFGVCVGEDRAWVLAVGGGLEELLEQSVLLKGVVGEVEPGRSTFASQPRIADRMSGENWLACGGAAMSFDPICGEGTGHALREAILATAIVKAHAAGEPWDVLTKLYEQRLKGGFKKHLQQCRQLYASGGTGPWWQAQLASVADDGVAVPILGSKYRLDGFDLVSLRD